MSGNPLWQATIHRASADPTPSPYTEVALTTVQGYTGYTSLDVPIVAPQGTWSLAPQEIKDVAGNVPNTKVPRRRVFELLVYPHLYNDHATEPDLTDIDTIAAFVTVPSRYYWLSIVGGTRAYPSDTAKVHPVYLQSWAETPNLSTGTRSLVLTFGVRSLS